MTKGTLYLLLFTMLFLSCTKETPEDTPKSSCNFTNYWYYIAPNNLGELSNDYILVGFDTTYSEVAIRKFITGISDFDQHYRYTLYSNKYVALKFNSPKTCEAITDIIFNLQKNPIVEFASYTMKTNDCHNMIWMPIGNLCVNTYSNHFWVKVLDENKLTDLYKMIAETKTELLEQDPLYKEWFLLKTTKNSKGDALKMVNYFYDSKLFAVTEPNILKLPVE